MTVKFNAERCASPILGKGPVPIWQPGKITRQRTPPGMRLARGEGWYRYEIKYGRSVEVVGHRVGTRESVRRYVEQGVVAMANVDDKRTGARPSGSGWLSSASSRRKILAALRA